MEVAVRASYIASWTSANGTILNDVRNGKRVAQFTIGADWEKSADGHYYYKDILGTKETSTDFISTVTFNPNIELEEEQRSNVQQLKLMVKQQLTVKI